MPIYEYICLECETHFEKMQKVSEDRLKKCEKCGGDLEKKWSLSGFQFKGAGWYVTDYANNKGEKPGTSAKSEKKSADESTAKPESASNQTKDTASDAKKETVSKKE